VLPGFPSWGSRRCIDLDVAVGAHPIFPGGSVGFKNCDGLPVADTEESPRNDNSVRGFSTDERRARSFNDIDDAYIALVGVRIRFPRIAGQVSVRSRP